MHNSPSHLPSPPPQPQASPKDKVAKHHCCGGCVTRAGSITPRTHDQQGGLSRAGHKFGGVGVVGGRFWTLRCFAANRLKFVLREKSAFASMRCMWAGGASHAAQTPATRGCFTGQFSSGVPQHRRQHHRV